MSLAANSLPSGGFSQCGRGSSCCSLASGSKPILLDSLARAWSRPVCRFNSHLPGRRMWCRCCCCACWALARIRRRMWSRSTPTVVASAPSACCGGALKPGHGWHGPGSLRCEPSLTGGWTCHRQEAAQQQSSNRRRWYWVLLCSVCGCMHQGPCWGLGSKPDLPPQALCSKTRCTGALPPFHLVNAQ